MATCVDVEADVPFPLWVGGPSEGVDAPPPRCGSFRAARCAAWACRVSPSPEWTGNDLASLEKGGGGGEGTAGGRPALHAQEPKPSTDALEAAAAFSDQCARRDADTDTGEQSGQALAPSMPYKPQALGARPPSTDEVREQARERRAAARQASEESDTEPDDDAAPAGAGLLGVGKPLQAGMGPYARDVRDGAGLCSPGKWPPERRSPTSSWTIKALGAAFRREITRLPGNIGAGADEVFDKLAKGFYSTTPFPADSTNALRGYAEQLLADEGHPGAGLPRPGDRPQPIRIRLLEALLRSAGDPDVNCWARSDGSRQSAPQDACRLREEDQMAPERPTESRAMGDASRTSALAR